MLFSKIATQSLKTAAARRGFHAAAAVNAKVAVLGAAGGIGQPLSLLLKLSPEVDELACYDIVGTPGVAADLSHVSKKEVKQCGAKLFFRRSAPLFPHYIFARTHALFIKLYI